MRTEKWIVGPCVLLTQGQPERRACGAWRGILATLALCVAVAIPSSGQSFRSIFSFNGTTNGSQPIGPLVPGFDGNLYGVTFRGGAQNEGTIFKITTAGALTTIYNFCSQTNCADGGYPSTGLVLGEDGNLYGSTGKGGSANYGTFFKITPKGSFTAVYNWCELGGGCSDVSSGSIILGRDGNFWGVGATSSLFKITPTGKLTLFPCEGNCPGVPGDPIQATNSYVYGVSVGKIIQATTSGYFTTLHDFCTPTSCGGGSTGLVQAGDGDLYGSNVAEYGSVFTITLKGSLTTIYDFCSQSNCADGAGPRAPLIQGTDGNFYGTTTYRGGMDGGTLFKLTPTGALTVLHNFPSWRSNLYALTQATDGNFYGMTVDNATGYYGIVYKESMGLSPFIKLVENSGFVGNKITILGTNLTGATEVGFNGTAATFSVVSATEISATVSNGATTGPITVTTPSATLNSSVAFQVR